MTYEMTKFVHKTSDSGIGDHGPAGIASFIDQHQCNFICVALELPLLSNNQPSDTSEDFDGNCGRQVEDNEENGGD